jgi:rRNA biogenesis protein RRP5
MAFMKDKLGIESARKVAERGVKSISMTNEQEKFNMWIAYINLENSFGELKNLQDVVKRALEVNDKKKVYL